MLTCKGRGIQNPFHQSKRKKDYLRMEGQAVFRFAVTMVPRCIKQILKKTGYDTEDIKFFVLHQANVRILDELNRNNLLEPGDKIVLSGFGGGLTWGAVLIEW